MEPDRTPTAPPDPPEQIAPPDADLGGESPCWMHLLDDEGRMPESP